uniref:Uncharacterized protein n=1 Tax=Siphoviridae sp. ctFPV4 TaxID=2827819 RepID=A0A8S5SJG7_9CAUD|nr:MAG TPA: hypothetical protein [Siphoviridae sp. ctFPV4]
MDSQNSVLCYNGAEVIKLWTDLASAIITSVFTLVGVFIGAKLTNASSSRQEEKKILSEFYADVFIAYSNYVICQNNENIANILSACEKTKLLCSEKSAEVLNALAYAVTREHPVPHECKNIVDQLRNSAKDDVRNR